MLIAGLGVGSVLRMPVSRMQRGRAFVRLNMPWRRLWPQRVVKRRVQGVVHGASSSGQTVFVEPLETIEQNNELVRLFDEEQAEIHRILLALLCVLDGNQIR